MDDLEKKPYKDLERKDVLRYEKELKSYKKFNIDKSLYI